MIAGKKFFQSIALTCVLLVIAFLGSAYNNQALADEATQCEQCKLEFKCVREGVGVEIKDPNKVSNLTFKAPWLPYTTVSLVMDNLDRIEGDSLTLSKKFSCPYGDQITQINDWSDDSGKTDDYCDRNECYYWSVFINNVLAPRGIATMQLNIADQVLWKQCNYSGDEIKCKEN